MGPRGSQDLRSPSLIMAPGPRNGQKCGACNWVNFLKMHRSLRSTIKKDLKKDLPALPPREFFIFILLIINRTVFTHSIWN